MQFYYTRTGRRRTDDHCRAHEKHIYCPETQVLNMPTKTLPISSLSLPLVEAFYTIQGEGFHQGKAAYFIRLGGCDVGCVWCDVKESWDVHKHPLKSIDEIVTGAISYPARLAVITGGEPLMHNLDELTKALQVAGFT